MDFGKFVAMAESARMKEILKQDHKVADSIDDLVCKHHPTSGFEAVREIPGSQFSNYTHVVENGKVYIKAGKKLKIYECKQCKEDKHALEKTLAYECPACGIVLGEPYKKPYNDIGLLSGSSGENYFCSICNSQIGQEQHSWSVMDIRKRM